MIVLFSLLLLLLYDSVIDLGGTMLRTAALAVINKAELNPLIYFENVFTLLCGIDACSSS